MSCSSYRSYLNVQRHWCAFHPFFFLVSSFSQPPLFSAITTTSKISYGRKWGVKVTPTKQRVRENRYVGANPASVTPCCPGQMTLRLPFLFLSLVSTLNLCQPRKLMKCADGFFLPVLLLLLLLLLLLSVSWSTPQECFGLLSSCFPAPLDHEPFVHAPLLFSLLCAPKPPHHKLVDFTSRFCGCKARSRSRENKKRCPFVVRPACRAWYSGTPKVESFFQRDGMSLTAITLTRVVLPLFCSPTKVNSISV